MEDERYNPSTDNLEKMPETPRKKEPPRLNPSTGISNFAGRSETPHNFAQRKMGEQRELTAKEELQKFKEQAAYERGKGGSKQEVLLAQVLKEMRGAAKTEEEIRKERRGKFLSRFGFVKRKIETRPIKDKLKVLRLQNMLDKKRLQNQIESLKLQKKVELLRKKGMLKQVISQPILKIPQQLYPAYATPEIAGDIDSAFNADISGAGNDLWGDESFFGGESYYDEKYWDDELNLSPWEHLNIKPRQGLSPLLW